ncbi:MAG TPA: kelch repeat-containing protein [Planctomycetota bacterium]|nr:kelch repeat-containing protein [Planctomycetota bacterium]
MCRTLLASLVLLASTNAQAWLKAPVLEPRSGQGMVYDSLRHRVVMFGGFQTGRYDETWEWDGVAWTLRTPNTRPPGRRDHSMAYDSARQRVVMFGGNGVTGGLGDTWEFDGVDWSERHSPESPSRRDGAAMVYDAARGVTVLFGGQAPLQNDTWLWDGTRWRMATPATSPGAHSLGSMAYDEARQTVVMFGGSTAAGNSNDTWEWNGVDWAQASPPHQPPMRQRHSLAYDPVGGRTLLFGGSSGSTRFNDVWLYDGNDWVQAPTPAIAPVVRDRAGVAFDAHRNRTVVFGGRGPTNSNNLGDTWEWDGVAWTQRAITRQPAARREHAMAYDAAHDAALLFGGLSGANTLQDTWSWDGAQWTEHTPVSPPPPRHGHAMAFDGAHARVVLFGGVDATGNDLDDTWLWDGSSWLQASPLHVPLARSGHAMAYDDASDTIVMFGGVFGGIQVAIDETWQWDGVDWQLRNPVTPPPARHGHALAWDAARDRVLLFGGTSAGGSLADTWEWDGSQWTQALPGLAPSARSGHAMTYDPTLGHVIVFGGTDAASALQSDTWQWDGSSWTPAATSGPGARSSLGMITDSLRRRTVLFGGALATGESLETWEYRRSDAADVTPFGAGCGGLSGVPSLRASDVPGIGGTIVLRIGALQPGSPSLLALGIDRALLDVGAGCSSYLPNPLGIVAAGANAAGIGSYPLSVPNATSLVGVRYFAQGAGVDATGPFLGLFSLTRGLDLLIGL